MRDTEVTDDFLRRGGTEVAPMSTTTRLDVALRYAVAPGMTKALIFKIRTDSFMQRGAAIQFLSAFPEEEEFLYPPLTFLKPSGKPPVTMSLEGRTFTIVEVMPQFGG